MHFDPGVGITKNYKSISNLRIIYPSYSYLGAATVLDYHLLHATAVPALYELPMHQVHYAVAKYVLPTRVRSREGGGGE